VGYRWSWASGVEQEEKSSWRRACVGEQLGEAGGVERVLASLTIIPGLRPWAIDPANSLEWLMAPVPHPRTT
jgi:hypothetical protein